MESLSELLTWQFWLIAAIIPFILEIFTPGFLLACFGLSALISVIPAALGLSPGWALLTFSICSVLLLWLLRPLVIRLSARPEVQTNADALIGKEVRVVEAIDATRNTGTVKVDGEVWTAKNHNPNDYTILAEGTPVRICKRKGLILYVERII